MSKLFKNNEWDFDVLRKITDACAKIAVEELHLDIYPIQIEIIDSSQMLDAYSSNGLPMMYNHWSFGKHFLQHEHSYRGGHSGLAMEIVINSSPCISYLMEDNSATIQTLVIAHAGFGHNHFFKNNYLFKQWTDAEGILDYLQFAKNYITKCEEKHGLAEVEATLDACHAISDYGVDRYKRPTKLSKKKEIELQNVRADYVQQQANELWSTLHQKENKSAKLRELHFPEEPQENIMYFLEKNSPVLESWQREIVRIVRKIAQYFYPQRQTKLMNEGWASFTHFYIMNRLWEKGLINDGSYLEFIHSHSGVVTQLPYNHKYYNGFNVYALGLDMFNDIKRVCENPTDEDKACFPHLIGQHWLDVCLDAVANYRDESFVSQFLSPTVMKKWGLFEITNNEHDKFVTVSGIQDMRGYNAVRKTLSNQYSSTSHQPNIQIINANLAGSRTLELKYTAYNNAKLNNSGKVINCIKYLWGYDVSLDG